MSLLPIFSKICPKEVILTVHITSIIFKQNPSYVLARLFTNKKNEILNYTNILSNKNQLTYMSTYNIYYTNIISRVLAQINTIKNESTSANNYATNKSKYMLQN